MNTQQMSFYHSDLDVDRAFCTNFFCCNVSFHDMHSLLAHFETSHYPKDGQLSRQFRLQNRVSLPRTSGFLNPSQSTPGSSPDFCDSPDLSFSHFTEASLLPQPQNSQAQLDHSHGPCDLPPTPSSYYTRNREWEEDRGQSTSIGPIREYAATPAELLQRYHNATHPYKRPQHRQAPSQRLPVSYTDSLSSQSLPTVVIPMSGLSHTSRHSVYRYQDSYQSDLNHGHPQEHQNKPTVPMHMPTPLRVASPANSLASFATCDSGSFSDYHDNNGVVDNQSFPISPPTPTYTSGLASVMARPVSNVNGILNHRQASVASTISEDVTSPSTDPAVFSLDSSPHLLTSPPTTTFSSNRATSQSSSDSLSPHPTSSSCSSIARDDLGLVSHEGSNATTLSNPTTSKNDPNKRQLRPRKLRSSDESKSSKRGTGRVGRPPSDGRKRGLRRAPEHIKALLKIKYAPQMVDGAMVYRCPEPGCIKIYKNYNGLRYHLTEGTCEMDEAYVLNNKEAEDLVEMYNDTL